MFGGKDMALFGMFNKKSTEEAKLKAEPEEKIESFVLDLNNENVRKLYEKCKPTDATKEVYRVVLQKKELGFPEDSVPLLLDVSAVDENLSSIWYLFGQLQAVHQVVHDQYQSPFLPIKDILKKYDGTFWTSDKAAPMYLMHLGIAAGYMMPPVALTKNAFIGTDVLSTLSPNDSEFVNWYSQNKTKLIIKRQNKEHDEC